MLMFYLTIAGTSSFFESGTALERRRRSSSAEGTSGGGGEHERDKAPSRKGGGVGDLPHENFVIKDD